MLLGVVCTRYARQGPISPCRGSIVTSQSTLLGIEGLAPESPRETTQSGSLLPYLSCEGEDQDLCLRLRAHSPRLDAYA